MHGEWPNQFLFQCMKLNKLDINRMKTVFEADPNGEITQVSLWRAYQKQFESYDALMKSGSIPTMLTASDVIKGTQEAFDTASPKQVEEDGQRRFIISGIKIKPPQPIMMTPAERERDLWRCKWNGCQFARPEAEPFENASQLYEHLENAHLEENPATLSSSSSSSTRQICRFEQCNLSFDTRRQLHFHLRTHIPTRTPLSPSAPPTLAHAADAFDRMKTFFTEQRQIPQTVQGEYAAGIGFVASLVVRNCARATVAAAQRYRRSTGLVAVSGSANSNNEGMHLDGGNNSTRGSKNAALDNEEDDIHRRKMFGFLTGSTTDDTTSEDKDQFESGNNGSEALPHLTADQVKNAVSALCSVEQEIIAVNAANKALTSYLMETLVCIEDAKKAVDGVL